MSARSDAYATALAEVASAEGQLDTVADQVFQVARAVEASDELRSTLVDRSVPVARRLGVIDDLLGNVASPTTVNLVSMVVGSDRAGDLPDIADALRGRAAEAKGSTVGVVRSAIPLSSDQQTRLAQALGRATGKNVDVQVVVDRSIRGGLVAEVDDQVFDGSIVQKLEKLRAAL